MSRSVSEADVAFQTRVPPRLASLWTQEQRHQRYASEVRLAFRIQRCDLFSIELVVTASGESEGVGGARAARGRRRRSRAHGKRRRTGPPEVGTGGGMLTLDGDGRIVRRVLRSPSRPSTRHAAAAVLLRLTPPYFRTQAASLIKWFVPLIHLESPHQADGASPPRGPRDQRCRRKVTP